MDVQSPSIPLHRNNDRLRNLSSALPLNPIRSLTSPNRIPSNNPYHNR
jgi:hypothetical protein